MTTQPNGQTLINQVANFYQQYLHCSPEQLDLLALWTMHTHIIPASPFSPALNICSRQKYSGKTLCLQLLSLLCDHGWMHTAAAPSLLLHQLTDGYEPFVGTLLLDDCDATFGKSRMNLKLQGLFTARFQQDARFTVRVKDDGEYIFDDRLVFFPAAFAGHGRLHPSLAERSIQIALESKKPGSGCQPFRFYAAQNSSKPLNQGLSDWGDAHHDRFEKIAPYKEDQFPPELSWRNRDCAEPLLHVADFIGGDWPQRARQALVNGFALAAFEDFYSSKQILSDVRDAFAEKGNPEWLSSTDVLSFLYTMDNRTWDDWSKGKPMQPKAVAHLLEPFGVQPRNHRTGPKTVPKGYYRADLEPVWQRHLPELTTKIATCGTEACPRGECRIACPEVRAEGTPGCDEGIFRSPALPVAAELQNSALSTPKLTASSQKPVAPPVAANLQNSVPINPKPVDSHQSAATHNPVAAELQNSALSSSRPTASSQKPVAPPVAANLQNSALSTPKLTASNQKPVAPPVAAELQNSALSSPKLTASSQKPVAPPVAAELQISVPINPKPVDSHQPAATSNRVAAELQNSALSSPHLTASSQKLVAPPVAANLQNSALSTPKLAASSPKPVAPPVAADLQDSTLSRSRLEHLLRYQPKAASSPKPVAPPVQNSVPLLGANWRAAAKNAPPPSHFAGNVKKNVRKEDIGHRIIMNR